MLVTLRNQLCLEISMRQLHPQTLTCCFRYIGAVSLVFFVISCPTPTRERADQNVDRLPHSGCACARCCARRLSWPLSVTVDAPVRADCPF